MELLRACQMLQLRIAKEIMRICNENNIRPFMIAGTFLGAIRHNGFIPWDDDMDLGMFRSDYERFVLIAQKTLGPEYYIQNWDLEPNYAFPFAKVRLKDTEFVEKSCELVKIRKGIYVDIFPFDNLSDNEKLRKKQIREVTYYKHLLLNKCNYTYVSKQDKTKYLISKILCFASRFYSIDWIHKKYYYAMTKYNNIQTQLVVTFGGSSKIGKETLKYEWINVLTKYKFEDEMLYGPEDYSGYLTHFFGDYMTPPPENVRYIGHNIVKIDLGPYSSILEENE